MISDFTFTAMAKETAKLIVSDPRVDYWLAERWIMPIIEAAFREVAALQREQDANWQPIETAPKDGTPVLLWKSNTREHYVSACIHGGAGLGWCTPDGFEIFMATHWMPLPSPPKERAAAIRATPETP